MMETRKVVYENPVIMEIEGYSLSRDKIVYFLNAKSFVDQVASGFELGIKICSLPPYHLAMPSNWSKMDNNIIYILNLLLVPFFS